MKYSSDVINHNTWIQFGFNRTYTQNSSLSCENSEVVYKKVSKHNKFKPSTSFRYENVYHDET